MRLLLLVADAPVMLQVSCDDPDEYKRTLRGQLRALLEREKDPLGPAEWVVCHVKQATPSDGLLKGPRKVGCCQPRCLPTVHAWQACTP